MARPVFVESRNGELPYRMLRGADRGLPPALLLHGYGGDENDMWVILSAVSPRGWAVAPRAPYALRGGGYSWVDSTEPGFSALEDFQPAVETVLELLAELEQQLTGVRSRLILIGFSQGAALAYALAGAMSVRPAGIVSLAGFVPEGTLRGLEGLRVYWAHGVADERVSIERARRDVGRLESLDVEITFCAEEVGHKVGVICMRGLRDWLGGQTSGTGGSGPSS